MGHVQQIFSSEFEKFKKEVSLDVIDVSEAAVTAFRKSSFSYSTDQTDSREQPLTNKECQICGKMCHKAPRFKRFNTMFNNEREGYRDPNNMEYARREWTNRPENTSKFWTKSRILQ